MLNKNRVNFLQLLTMLNQTLSKYINHFFNTNRLTHVEWVSGCWVSLPCEDFSQRNLKLWWWQKIYKPPAYTNTLTDLDKNKQSFIKVSIFASFSQRNLRLWWWQKIYIHILSIYEYIDWFAQEETRHLCKLRSKKFETVMVAENIHVLRIHGYIYENAHGQK